MKAARINGVTLHYRLVGQSTGRPVIAFSNSLGTDLRIWDEVATLLSDEFTLLLYDKRGHGLSELGELPLTMDDHVDDLIGLIEHLSLGPVTLCGLSVGGQIVQGVYGKRRDLVASIVLMDTAHKIGTLETWNERIDKVRSDGIASMSDSILERWFSRAYRENASDFPLYRAMLERTTVAGYSGTCEALRDSDFTEVARSISVPTLLIVGEEDGSTPPDLVRSTADLIADSRLEIIPKAGHLPNVEKPDLVAKHLRAFMNERKAGGR